MALDLDDNSDIELLFGGKRAFAAAVTEKPKIDFSFAGSYDYFQRKDNKINGELENIEKGVSPYEYDSTGTISIADAIRMCQKAYWNVAIFRSTIDIQTEFSNARLHFKSNNKRVVKFYENWYKKINGWSFAEKFFLEWFRSGNVFIYKFNAPLDLKEYRKYTRASESIAGEEIPLRYIIINPADVRCRGASTFLNAKYSKLLNRYELDRLKNPSTDEEKQFVESLSEENKKSLKSGSQPMWDIDPKNLIAIFCGKTDYEALAVPMYYPVLSDIDLKLEFKKAEKVLARTVDQAVLLMTAGEKDAKPSANQRILADLAEVFSAESVGRVVISDYTTKGEWLIPDLNKVFGPEKYTVVNADIASGLMNLFFGEEKYANSMVKIQIFLERLNHARDAYINYFLKPEMELIAKTFGFQTIPEVEFEEIDIKDQLEYDKLFVRMAELGLFTPEETFTAIKTRQFPLRDDSKMAQEDFKADKEKGLYEPLINNKKQENGRPAGTKAPQSTKKVTPIGASVEEGYSALEITASIKDFYSLLDKVENDYKSTHSITRLSKKHRDVCRNLAENFAASFPRSKWDSFNQLDANNKDFNYSNEVLDIAARHDLSIYLASILANSKKND